MCRSNITLPLLSNKNPRKKTLLSQRLHASVTIHFRDKEKKKLVSQSGYSITPLLDKLWKAKTCDSLPLMGNHHHNSLPHLQNILVETTQPWRRSTLSPKRERARRGSALGQEPQARNELGKNYTERKRSMRSERSERRGAAEHGQSEGLQAQTLCQVAPIGKKVTSVRERDWHDCKGIKGSWATALSLYFSPLSQS